VTSALNTGVLSIMLMLHLYQGSIAVLAMIIVPLLRIKPQLLSLQHITSITAIMAVFILSF